ncbi:Uncharacterised protein [Legionella busanensis]|uniref:Uncharacterized protein n=1 Tax=Legionella busanensis TaxID=190655 RepID=A0A378JHH6_9GAMM|nr:hypothetical protein [Legionella busanensis]STX50138.1 Uncharacterised protein [Legionella busanensis]
MYNKNCKIQIYKGIIQFLLDSTTYSLKDIADIAETSIKNIRLIYLDEILPSSFTSELKLIKIYQIILEFNLKLNRKRNF